MRKVVKQLVVNIGIAMFSLLLLFIIKSLANGQFITIEQFLCAEFIFALISALMTTIGWRFAEGIVGCWWYNFLLTGEAIILLIEYGYALSESTPSSVLLIFTAITAILSGIFYVLENIIIYTYFRKKSTADAVNVMERTSYSYKDREDL